MRLRILDRYIFQEVIFAFLFAICAFTAVFIGSGTLFRIARYITDYGASLSSVVKIFIYGLPNIIMWTFPMSMLLATLFDFRAAVEFKRNYRNEILRNKFRTNCRARNFFGHDCHGLRDSFQ